MTSAFATVVTILLAVSVYRLNDRVNVLEQYCIVRPSHWTEDANDPALDQVYQQLSIIY